MDDPSKKERRKRRHHRKKKRRASSATSATTSSSSVPRTNGELLVVVFSVLLLMVLLANVVLHSFLPDDTSSLSSGGEDGREAYGAEVQAGLRATHVTNRDLRPVGQNPEIPNSAPDSVITNNVSLEGNGDDDGQAEILKVLSQAGVQVDQATLATLPKWSDITSMYGPEPIIYGLDTCESFQTMQDPADGFIGPAGIFNTGTNLLSELLRDNCAIPARKKRGRGPGMRFQVPWGKHNPVKTYRLHNVAKAEKKERIDQTAVLPVVTTKDPYGWFGSMCRHQYAARWPHRDHCPNLVLTDREKRMGGRDNGVDGGVPVTVGYGTTQKDLQHYTSLAGLWNEWYGDYFDITEYPRLIIRFEDLMIRPKEIVTKVCECGGGKIKDPNNFVMVAGSAKGNKGTHKGSEGLVNALIRYGDPSKRVDGMEEADLEYARKHLRSDLMDAFGYSHPPRI